MNNIRLNKFAIAIMMMIIFSSINIFSITLLQDDKKITEFASILKQKVLLSSDQETKVINILSDMYKNISSKPENKNGFIKEAQGKIESLLDTKQKMKYDIIKNDLWKKI
jgi:Skp family chaperone for outer membrane proteins